MYDLHYDLLTYILTMQNDLNTIKKYCYNIYKEENIIGGIFNLFYMSPIEMKKELKINYEEINIIENLKKVNKLIKKYELIPANIDYVFGIEGLDYLKDINDIDILYELGVRCVNIVWNNENKFASGCKNNNKGLTLLGKELVEKLIRTRIAIDLSHTNEKSFFDIIKICKKLKNYNPIVFASHSNCKRICNVDRNLTDKQILEIKNLNGIIGMVEIKRFCTTKEQDFTKAYIENIKHVKELIGNVENIGVSSDDMEYYKNVNLKYYKKENIFKHKKIKKDITKLLKNNKFTGEEIKKILKDNYKYKILQRL